MTKLPDLFDNLADRSTGAQLTAFLTEAQVLDICVGFVSTPGLERLVDWIDSMAPDARVQLLVGMSNSTAWKRGGGRVSKERIAAVLDRLFSYQDAGQLAVKQRLVKQHLDNHDLHAKLYLWLNRAGQSAALVGSSNLSERGLASQGELNLHVQQALYLEQLRSWFNARWLEDTSRGLTDIRDVIQYLMKGDVDAPEGQAPVISAHERTETGSLRRLPALALSARGQVVHERTETSSLRRSPFSKSVTNRRVQANISVSLPEIGDNSHTRQEKDWLRAEQLQADKSIVSGKVVDCKTDGVLVAMGLIHGFIPASHLSQESRMRQDKEADLSERFAPLVNMTLQVKVIDIERRWNRLILSEKEAMHELRNQRRESTLEELQVGETRKGVVVKLAKVGAFVNIGDAEGLIRIRELSRSKVNHPSEVLTKGEQVTVKIISVDKERKRIGLSLRQLQPRPWDTLAERYSVGDLVRATITCIKEFGAFARLANEPVEGLIHISEMSREYVANAADIVTVGEEYEVKIIRLDTERRRMGLSIKQTDLDWDLAPDEED